MAGATRRRRLPPPCRRPPPLQDLGLASFLGRELPWLKIVISIREPISQSISYCLHMGHLGDSNADEMMVRCLDHRFGLSNDFKGIKSSE